MSRLCRKKKSLRPIACLALALTCALVSPGPFLHEHDDGHAGSHDHNCVICLQHDFFVATTTAPGPVPPDLTTRAADPSRQQSGWGAPRTTQTTRGPPA